VTARPVTLRRFAVVVAGGLLAALVGLAVSLLFGEPVDVAALLTGGGSDVERNIFFDLRLPRGLTAAMVGGALGICGATYQALLRNPLAEPYLLGVSGGGSFGAVLAIVIVGASAGPSIELRAMAALVGCLVALGIVYMVATRGGALHPSTLLLTGAVVNAFFLAGLACVQYAATPTEAQAILRWVLGGVTYPSGRELVALSSFVVVGAGVLLMFAAPLNLLAFGEETARHLGVDVERTRRLVFVTTSVVIAMSVAVAGPVGFLGLFVPHAARFVVGTDHRVLLPASFFLGAAFLPLADAAARVVISPQELPVVIVTAVVGAPAFVLLLSRFRAGGGGVHG